MPTLVPDRVPTFDPASQRWHWWSTPGQPSSFQQDQERAETIEVIWETYDLSEGRTWIAVTPVLPGFAPFLWNISRKALWLRRPEGVWTTPLPTGMKRKDVVLVQEPCEGLPQRMNRRHPVECLFAASPNDWHPDGSTRPTTLDEYDQSVLGKSPLLMVKDQPVLISQASQKLAPDVSPYHPLVVDLWSRPGPMRFAHRRVQAYGALRDALIITLPNGVRVAHLFGFASVGEEFRISGMAAVLGDDRWFPTYIQPIILGDDV